MAEDLGDAGFELCFCEIFLGEAKAEVFVRFDCVKVAFCVREGFGHPDSRVPVACADFEDVFCFCKADELV